MNDKNILNQIFRNGTLPTDYKIKYIHNIDLLFRNFDTNTINEFLMHSKLYVSLNEFKKIFNEDSTNEDWNNLKKVFLNNKKNYDMLLFNRYD
jgi:hypothetical protein